MPTLMRSPGHHKWRQQWTPTLATTRTEQTRDMLSGCGFCESPLPRFRDQLNHHAIVTVFELIHINNHPAGRSNKPVFSAPGLV